MWKNTLKKTYSGLLLVLVYVQLHRHEHTSHEKNRIEALLLSQT